MKWVTCRGSSLVASVMQQDTRVAQEREKLQKDLGKSRRESSPVAHPNWKQTGRRMLEKVVPPSHLHVSQSHNPRIPVFKNVARRPEDQSHLFLSLVVDAGLEMDLLEDLETLKFESGIHEEDQSWLYLLGRSHGLMTKACAHATFFCKLLHNLRESFSRKLVPEKRTSKCCLTGLREETQDDDALKVGIIGGGHLGKQLAHTLLQFIPIPAENLRISTRRPETLDEFKKLGIQCFYQNASLVGWANVVFLCCLPSQLPNICVEIQTRLGKDCIVYSFVSAIPVSRLKLLLNHTNILRPQYQCAEDLAHIWGANKEITTALQDPVILQATCPYSPAGGISLNIKWLEGMFYALLNFCTAKDMPHSQVLRHLSELFPSQHLEACKEDEASPLKFQAQDFVSKIYAKNLSQKRPFPLFDLTAVQLKETPFSQYLSNSTTFQDHFTHLYYDSFGISLTKEQEPEVSTGSPSQ